jgi:hypothetical protein
MKDMFHSSGINASMGHLMVEFNASPTRTIGESSLLLPSYNNIVSAPGSIDDMLTDTL